MRCRSAPAAQGARRSSTAARRPGGTAHGHTPVPEATRRPPEGTTQHHGRRTRRQPFTHLFGFGVLTDRAADEPVTVPMHTAPQPIIRRLSAAVVALAHRMIHNGRPIRETGGPWCRSAAGCRSIHASVEASSRAAGARPPDSGRPRPTTRDRPHRRRLGALARQRQGREHCQIKPRAGESPDSAAGGERVRRGVVEQSGDRFSPEGFEPVGGYSGGVAVLLVQLDELA